ncbi:MAG: cysteine hydrolase [Chlamydiales bacterium]|nr:cysteine hydrolase [Chlamydiales bacterium]
MNQSIKTAIITLDLINEICHPKGKLARYADRIANKKIIETTNRVTAWGREKGHLIFHVRVGFHPHYHDASTRARLFKHAKANAVLLLTEWGGQFCEELHVHQEDVQVIKHRVSAFYGTNLDLILRANRVEHLILTGVSTSNAVELTAREAHDRDYEVSILEDATECASDEEQQASKQATTRLVDWKTFAELVQ